MINKDNSTYMSVADMAKKLGVSRITIFKRIKKGQISAIKIGRSYAIPRDTEMTVLGADKREIDKGVKKVIEEYGETLKLLGKE